MISISVSRICDGVLAVSALRAAGSGSARPSILGRDDEAALHRCARDVVAYCLAQLLPVIKSTNFGKANAAEEDIITVEFDIRPPIEEAARAAFEAAVTAGLLATAYARPDAGAAAAYSRECDDACKAILALRAVDGRVRRITPEAA